MAHDIYLKDGSHAPSLDTLSYFDKTEPCGDDWVYFEKIEEKRKRVGAHIDASKLGSSPSSLEYRDFEPLPSHIGTGQFLETERANIVFNGRNRVVLSDISADVILAVV